jgi:hypothetical protein
MRGCCARRERHALAVTAKRLTKSRRLSGPRGMCFPTLPIGIAITGPWVILKCSEWGRRPPSAAREWTMHAASVAPMRLREGQRVLLSCGHRVAAAPRCGELRAAQKAKGHRASPVARNPDGFARLVAVRSPAMPCLWPRPVFALAAGRWPPGGAVVALGLWLVRETARSTDSRHRRRARLWQGLRLPGSRPAHPGSSF